MPIGLLSSEAVSKNLSIINGGKFEFPYFNNRIEESSLTVR